MRDKLTDDISIFVISPKVQNISQSRKQRESEQKKVLQ